MYICTVKTTYWWNIGVGRGEKNIKDEKAIMVGSSCRPYNDSPQKIHPSFIHSDIYSLCEKIENANSKDKNLILCYD